MSGNVIMREKRTFNTVIQDMLLLKRPNRQHAHNATGTQCHISFKPSHVDHVLLDFFFLCFLLVIIHYHMQKHIVTIIRLNFIISYRLCDIFFVRTLKMYHAITITVQDSNKFSRKTKRPSAIFAA